MAKYLKGEDEHINGALYYFIVALDEKEVVRALELIEVRQLQGACGLKAFSLTRGACESPDNCCVPSLFACRDEPGMWGLSGRVPDAHT